MVQVTSISPTAVQIYLDRGDMNLAIGTGFPYLIENAPFLVSNWHNFSGRNSRTGRALHTMGALPDRVRFVLWRRDNGVGEWKNYWLEKPDEEASRWYEHPLLGRKVDVGCLPLKENLSEYRHLSEFENDEVRIRPGQSVTILGFPRGLHQQNLPFWKGASVASEPEIDVNDLPLTMVDGLGARGLSGSPVFFHGSRYEKMEGGWQLSGPNALRLVGIYSGRDDELPQTETANLSRVWKASAIRETALGKRMHQAHD